MAPGCRTLSTVFVWEHVGICVAVIHLPFILKKTQSSAFSGKRKKKHAFSGFKSIFLCCIFYLYTVLTPKLYRMWVSVVQMDISVFNLPYASSFYLDGN